MANKYQFSIPFSEANQKWCEANLDDRDYLVLKDSITTIYYNVMQKNDILKALKAVAS